MLLPCLLCTACLLPFACSFMMEYDIHTLLDALTLCATVAVIYALTATPIKTTYQSDLDSVRWYYVVSFFVLQTAVQITTGPAFASRPSMWAKQGIWSDAI
jgi:ER lumen protein retaining receptor